VLELLFVPPSATNIMHTNDATVSAIGTKTHANLPALPMLAIETEAANKRQRILQNMVKDGAKANIDRNCCCKNLLCRH